MAGLEGGPDCARIKKANCGRGVVGNNSTYDWSKVGEVSREMTSYDLVGREM